MTLGDLFRRIKSDLENLCPNPRLEAQSLLEAARAIDSIEIYSLPEKTVSPEQVEQCMSLLKRRKSGEPLAYVTGCEYFFKRKFLVGPGALIPRPETERLVEEVLRLCPQLSLKILDLGTGTGCIGLSLVAERPQSRLTAVDISSEALNWAQKNADSLGLADRVTWFEGSAESFASAETFDVVVANPPYIDSQDPEVEASVRNYEPHLALFAEEQGMQLIREWADVASRHLRRQGWYLFEIGAGQGPVSQEMIRAHGSFSSVRILKDYAGRDRIIVAQRK